MRKEKNIHNQIEDGGVSQSIQQNIPNASSYFGRAYLELNFGEKGSEYFKPENYHPSKSEQFLWSQREISPSFISVLLEKARRPELKIATSKTGNKNQTTLPPNSEENPEIDALTNMHKTDWWTVGIHNLSKRLQNIDLAELEAEAGKFGYKIIWYRNNAGALDFYAQNTETANLTPRFYIIESYRLSTIATKLGIGKTVKNITLVPGEKTRFTVSNFNHQKNENQGSCILDSINMDNVQEFQNCLESENTLKKDLINTIGFISSTEVDQPCFNWSGSNAISLNFARKEFIKNFWKALTKHTTRAASKRDITINTETLPDTLSDRYITRELTNPNIGKTVSYIFKQLNQEYLTFLHLTDIRIGYSNGLIFKEYTLPEMDLMLKEFAFNDMHEEIKSQLVNLIMDIHDFNNEKIRNKNIIQVMAHVDKGITENIYYFNDLFKTSYTDNDGIMYNIPGVIMSINKFVMPTESTIIETLTGKTDIIDDHIRNMQNEELRERMLNNDMKEREVEKITLAESIVKDTVPEKAKLFEEVFTKFDNNWT